MNTTTARTYEVVVDYSEEYQLLVVAGTGAEVEHERYEAAADGSYLEVCTVTLSDPRRAASVEAGLNQHPLVVSWTLVEAGRIEFETTPEGEGDELTLIWDGNSGSYGYYWTSSRDGWVADGPDQTGYNSCDEARQAALDERAERTRDLDVETAAWAAKLSELDGDDYVAAMAEAQRAARERVERDPARSARRDGPRRGPGEPPRPPHLPRGEVTNQPPHHEGAPTTKEKKMTDKMASPAHPPAPSGDDRKVVVSFRISQHDLERLRALAEDVEGNLSMAVRRLIRTAIAADE